MNKHILKILVFGLMIACLMRVKRSPHIFIFDHDDQWERNIHIRVYCDYHILCVVKKIRRKSSERKKANKYQKSIYGNRKNKEMKILSWNSGHTYLINQINEIKWLIQDKSPHILFVYESNLRRSHDIEQVKIEGYSLHTSKMIRNPDIQVSRIVAYVKDGIVVRRRDDLESDEISAIWMEAGLPQERKYLVCGVYREWAHLKTDGCLNYNSGSLTEQEKRWEIFLDTWEDALDETEDVSVMGDVNIDLGKVFLRGNHKCRKMADDLMVRIVGRGVVQLVTENTRFVPSSDPSLLDHVYMTRPELGTHSVSEWGTSDHRLLELKKKVKGPLPDALRIRKRTFKHFCRKSFLQDVKAIKWFESVYSKNDVDSAAEGWCREFSKVLDSHCPVKSILVRKNYTPWMTPDLEAASKSLQRAQRSAKNNWNIESRRLVQAKTIALKEKLNTAEGTWKFRESKKMSETGAKTWENVKKWTGWRSTSQPVLLKDPSNNNSITFGAAKLCKIMNEFYLEKVRVIKQDMPLIDGDPCAELKEMLGDNSVKSFALQSVTPEIVLKTGRRMRKTKSMGRDEILADLFLLALPFMLPAVTHVINLSLLHGKFPVMWKISKICPLFKGGDQSSREEPKQYRPVALLPACARLLEKIVCDQVMEHLYAEDLLHSNNHGYRKGHGTISALLEAQEEALEAMDTGDIMGIVTLDQSAAFDVVEHGILLEKMKLYGFDNHALEWFKSYLRDRSQFVALEASKSEEKFIGPYACPQGSCLGPLIWNLYCGEVSEVLPLKMKTVHDDVISCGVRRELKSRWKIGNLVQYADDIMVLVRGKTLETVRYRASEAYKIMQDWF